MRQIKASEVEPGMTVKWKRGKFTHEVPVERVHSSAGGRTIWFVNGVDGLSVHSDTTVTVLAEPQPEEPQEFGEKVVVAGERALCIAQGLWLTDGLERCTWDDLCEMGPVTVIPDQGWTAPETPEVPERIEEWPEDDEHLRAYSWRDHDGDTWGWLNDEAEWECRSSVDIRLGTSRRPVSEYGPWTRKDD